jgi:4beta-methylsterol monooxygenase
VHRKYQPFTDAKLTHYEDDENCVYLTYDTLLRERAGFLYIFRPPAGEHALHGTLLRISLPRFEYWRQNKHWCYLRPIGEKQMRLFFLFYFDALKISLTSVKMQNWLQLKEDCVDLEAEQLGYDQD